MIIVAHHHHLSLPMMQLIIRITIIPGTVPMTFGVELEGLRPVKHLYLPVVIGAHHHRHSLVVLEHRRVHDKTVCPMGGMLWLRMIIWCELASTRVPAVLRADVMAVMAVGGRYRLTNVSKCGERS